MIETKLKAKNCNRKQLFRLFGSRQLLVNAARSEATGWLTDPPPNACDGIDLR